MAFKIPRNLYYHWVTQHSPPNHFERTQCKCKECPAGFPTSGDLNKHHLNNHNGEDTDLKITVRGHKKPFRDAPQKTVAV
ncbi:hypothetical protein T484DRAFT_1870461 [Baffinella frigidus]|nr:hypothetical protein T484DRAFT_1870461 [Cryptophyta sp. CCMP2293]